MDKLIVKGRMSQGFGIVPKLIMKDKRLTLQAKGIYAYFCSYAGNGTTAFPTVKQIINDLCISRETYNKHLRLLENCGYITVMQQRNDKGVFSRNIYTLNDFIEDVENSETLDTSDIEPTPKKPTTDETRSKNSTKSKNVSPRSKKPTSVFTVTDKLDTNINNINIKDIYNKDIYNKDIYIYNNKNNIYNNQSVRQSNINNNIYKTNRTMTDRTDRNNKYDYETIVKDNIDYESYLQDLEYCRYINDKAEENKIATKIDLLDDIVSIMVDVLESEGKIKIKGELKPKSIVESQYLKLENKHIEYVLNKLMSKPSVIKDKVSYLRTLLYMSVLEYNIDVQNFSKTYMQRKEILNE